MLERRAYNRYWINRAAIAARGTLVLSKRCRLRDASASGVGLWLGGATVVPLEFDIEVEGNLIPVRCRLAWRHNDFVGLRLI